MEISKELAGSIVTAVIIVGVYFYQKRKAKKTTDGGDDSSGRSSRQGAKLLGQYSVNYTELARQGKLQPITGRQHEIEHLIRVLSRKTKNNAILIGEPGVGKTAVVERLAMLMMQNAVPETLQGKELVELDLASLVAGTKYRGELEKRIDAITKALRAEEKHIVLFVDEIQQLAQASGAEGGLNPGDILKPELARGQLQMIGATTTAEYEQYILPEESLERRFQPIHIHEPSREATIAMLNGVKPVFEKYHTVCYSEEVIGSIVDLTHKYIHKRFLPDKAIDVLDEVGVRVHLLHLKNKTDETKKEPAVVSVDDVRQVIADWVEKTKEEIL